MPDNLPNKRFYTVKEVAKLLGFSTNTVYKYLEEGKIKSTRLGEEGRFRVPRNEMNRLLQEKGVLPNVGSLIPAYQESKPSLLSSESIVSSPSLFDWLVSMVAIAVGFMQFAFPVGLTNKDHWFVVIILVSIKYLIMLFGIGIIISDIFSPISKGKKVHKLLHLGTALLFGALAISFVFTPYPFLVLTYGALSVVMILSFFIEIDEYLKFLILSNIYALFGGIILFFHPEDLGASSISSFITANSVPFLVIWIFVYIVFFFLSFLSIKKKGLWLFPAPVIVFIGSCLYGAAAFYGGFWEKAINCIVLASFAPIFPFYKNFEAYTLKSKKDLIKAVAWVSTLFVIGGILIFFLRIYFETAVLSEMDKRADAAVGIIDSFVEGDKSKVLSYSFDSALVETITSPEDEQAIEEVLKKFFVASNGTFRSFVAQSVNGKIVARYPAVPGAIGIDVSDRDYFKAIKNGDTSYVSYVHQPRTPGTIPSIAVGSPIMSPSGKFLGVLLGSVDLEELSNLLGEIKYGSKGQICVVDNTNNYILNSDPASTIEESNDPVSKLTLEGKEGQVKAYSSEKVLMFKTYKPAFSGKWGIILTDPYTDAMRSYSLTSLTVFLVVLVCGVGSLILVSYVKKKD